MKAITIQQPWAHLIIHGSRDCLDIDPQRKNVENRTWPSSYRGPLLIHAGQGKSYMDDAGIYGLKAADMVFGAIIGIVDMYGCEPKERLPRNHWVGGPWCHQYRNPRYLRVPIKCKGALGLWTPTPELLDAIDDQGFEEVKP